MNKQMENTSFSRPINLSEEGKWLLAVTSFEATNSVFNITNGNYSFLITTPGHFSFRGAAETIQKLNKSFEMGANYDINLHVEEVRRRGNQITTGEKDYNLSDLDTQKNWDN